MNIAYKHLQDKLRIFDLTVPQWCAIGGGVLLAGLFAFYLSPFGTGITIFIAVYMAGVPAGLVMVAGQAQFSLTRFATAWWDWRRNDYRYTAGPGETAVGFVVSENPEEARRRSRETTPTLDMEALWDS